jgi:hypothetical protein
LTAVIALPLRILMHRSTGNRMGRDDMSVGGRAEVR